MKKIVISAINFFEGGPLSIYKDCLDNIVEKKIYENFDIIAFVHKKECFLEYEDKVEIIELPKSRKSYLYRLWYEYIYFYFFSKSRKIDVWLSLHDITPNVIANKKYVYCHNPSPFMKTEIKNLKYSKRNFMFSVFYKYLYMINIKKNDAVIVQQDWIRNKFIEMYKLKTVIVARPNVNVQVVNPVDDNVNDKLKKFCFLYPSYPRFFKNFEVICEACQILNEKEEYDFDVLLTIDGTENKYARDLKDKYSNLRNIKFIGLQERNELFKLYNLVDCMLFPSKLETWGLPISEFKETQKPMILANLPYAIETIGSYNKVSFFDVNNASELSVIMEKEMKNESVYTGIVEKNIEEPFANNWNELLDMVLNV